MRERRGAERVKTVFVGRFSFVVLFFCFLPCARAPHTMDANKYLATAGGILFAGSAALLAGRSIQAETDPTRRQLMSAGVVFL